MADTSEVTADRYNDLVERSVVKAVTCLDAHQDLQFIFAMASKNQVAMDGHNRPAMRLLDAIDRGDHSPSTVNMTFSRVVDAALEMGRPVEERIVAGQRRITIKPEEALRSGPVA